MDTQAKNCLLSIRVYFMCFFDYFIGKYGLSLKLICDLFFIPHPVIKTIAQLQLPKKCLEQ